MPENIFILIGRVLISLIFIYSGLGKLIDIAGAAGYFTAIGLPLPTPTAWLVGLLELLGGLAVLAGFQTRYAALALALFCVASALVAHLNFADMSQSIHFMKNLAMAGGLLALAASGSGAYSLDRARA